MTAGNFLAILMAIALIYGIYAGFTGKWPFKKKINSSGSSTGIGGGGKPRDGGRPNKN